MTLVRTALLCLLLWACGDKDDGLATDSGRGPDLDGDGWVEADDCDDGDASVNPEAAETCDGKDNDCDGSVDEDVLLVCYEDADVDGYGTSGTETTACSCPAGWAEQAGDCDDDDSAVSPSAAETWYDGADSDCDGSSDFDADGDGVDSSAFGGDDCDDSDSGVHPGARDLCIDGIDDDCDGVIDSPDAGTGLPSCADVVWEDVGHASAGTSVSTAGDTDGDGELEVVIGAPYHYMDGWYSGIVYLVSGLEGGSLADSDAAVLAASTADDAGYSVAGGGDTNGDGYDDLVIGAPHNESGGERYSGAAYIVLGPVDISSLSDAAATLTGGGDRDNAGQRVAMAGDTDGDGYDDALVSSSKWGSSDQGAVYVLTGPVTSGELDESPVMLTGHTGCGYAGAGLAGGGDVDGDGLRDVLVGAPSHSEGGTEFGAAFLLYGPATSQDLHDADVMLVGEHADSQAGLSVSSAGDTNADGYDDILIGAPYLNTGAYWGGGAHLVLGGEDLSGELNLAEADAVLYGWTAFQETGRALAGPGDLNADGYDDIVIGNHLEDEGATSSGSVYVVFGPVSSKSLELADEWWIGDRYNVHAGGSVAGVGDLDSDGYDDYAIGVTDIGEEDYGEVCIMLGGG